MLHRRLGLAPLLALALALPAAGPARAEDKPATPASPPAAPAATDAAGQIKQLQTDIDAAMKAKDDGALTTLAKKVPPLYKSTQDGPSKAALAKTLGSMMKNPKLSSSRKAALDALVEIEDGKEAWKAIQAQYPADDLDDPERFNLTFIKAVGDMHPDAAIDRLLESFRKGKQADVSAAAITALGNYHKSKQRERVFEEIVKAARNMVPSKSATANAEPRDDRALGGRSRPRSARPSTR